MLANFSSEFPRRCQGRAAVLGSDTFDVLGNQSCLFRRCHSLEKINFTTQTTDVLPRSSYTVLMGAWRQTSGTSAGRSLKCESLGNMTVVPEEFPGPCQWRTVVLGGDSFDASPDHTECHLQRCGSVANLKFSNAAMPRDAFTLLGGAFHQLTSTAQGVSCDCPELGITSLAPSSTATLLSNVSEPPLQCVMQALQLGADTLDMMLDRCILRLCGSFPNITFTDKLGPSATFTMLPGSSWSQLTRVQDGHSTDCLTVGSLDVPDGDDLPGLCFSKAIIVGSDTLDIDSTRTRCEFKRCINQESIAFRALGPPGAESYTRLVGGWSQLTTFDEQAATDCSDYLGSKDVSWTDRLRSCFAEAAIRGANTIDLRDMGTEARCYFSRCWRFGDFGFTTRRGPRESYTQLFPRRMSGSDCDPATCLDLHLMYTARVMGQHLPVGNYGQACDPRKADLCFGGAARRAAYAALKRQEFAELGENLVLMELGKSTFGGPLWDHPDYPAGAPSTMLQNHIPYDICAFAQGDFLTQDNEAAQQQLVESYGNRTCPFLLSNGRFGGKWNSFNSKVSPWIVKEMLNGWKVAFVSFFPYTPDYGYSYGSGVLDLGRHSVLETLQQGDSSDLNLRMDVDAFLRRLEEVDYNYLDLSPHLHDVFSLATLAPYGVLMAANEAKRAHPDIRATILLAPTDKRADSVEWLAKHGDFDVILRGDDVETQMLQSPSTGKQVLIAGSTTRMGVGHVRVRLGLNKGVEKYYVSKDVHLDSLVPSDIATQREMDKLYQVIRDRVAKPFGSIAHALRGGIWGQEEQGSKGQCYYTECNLGRVIGKAILWKARSLGFYADMSIYNLGGVRAPLLGNDLTVSYDHCKETLKFQNALGLYSIQGTDLYNTIKKYMLGGEIGLPGDGWRVTFHQPCWGFVNRTDYNTSDMSSDEPSNPPGTPAEIKRCRDAGVTDPSVALIDLDYLVLKDCKSPLECSTALWKPLQKGSTYVVVATDFLMNTNVGFRPFKENLDLGIDAAALCDFIKAHSADGPMEVQSWTAYRDRGNIEYENSKVAFQTGALIASVAQNLSHIETAPLCPPGQWFSEETCKECPAGRHSFTERGQVVCEPCEKGHFTSGSGQATCASCAVGSFARHEGATACKLCPAGKHSVHVGSRLCTNCQPGTYSAANGSSLCRDCPIGRYEEGTSSTGCNACGRSLVTRHPSSRDSGQCLCPAGKYWPSSGVSPLEAECQDCVKGMTCQMGSNVSNLVLNATIGPSNQFPLLKPYHWSSLEDPLSVFVCKTQVQCPGGIPGSACGPRLEGQACERCVSDHYWDGEECAECLDNFLIYPVLPIVATPIFVTLAYYTTSSPLEKWETWSGALGVALYILLGHYQTLGLLAESLDRLPAPVVHHMQMWKFANNIIALFEPNCFGFESFQSRIITAAMVPIFFAAFALLTMAGSWLLAWSTGKQKLSMYFDGTYNVIGNFLFTFFSGIIAQALTIFKCTMNPNGLESMKADRSITCYESEQWKNMLAVGVGSSILYCVLVGAMYARAVIVAPCHGNLKSPSFQWRWKFLFVKFRPDRYWFGMVCVTKSILVNVAPVVSIIDMTVLYWVMCVVMLYTVFVVIFMPFRYRAANWLDLFCNLILTLCCATMVMFSSPGVDVVETMSNALIHISFLPLAGSLIVVCQVLRKQRFQRSGQLDKELDKQFQKIKQCAAELAALPDDAGRSMLCSIGETDRYLFRSFYRLVQAELFGKRNYRISSGYMKERFSSYKRERITRTISVQVSNLSDSLRQMAQFGRSRGKVRRSTSAPSSSSREWQEEDPPFRPSQEDPFSRVSQQESRPSQELRPVTGDPLLDEGNHLEVSKTGHPDPALDLEPCLRKEALLAQVTHLQEALAVVMAQIKISEESEAPSLQRGVEEEPVFEVGHVISEVVEQRRFRMECLEDEALPSGSCSAARATSGNEHGHSTWRCCQEPKLAL